MDEPEGAIPLSEMVCWNLYQASRAVVAEYRRLLEPIGLSYPQYIALACLWEYGDHTVGALADRLQLEYGTMTPLLKRLEAAGLLTRLRDTEDERRVRVALTTEGRMLKTQARRVPGCILQATHSDLAEVASLTRQIQALRDRLVA